MDIERIQFKKHGDDRGMLVSLEQERNVPFDIRRVYYIFATQPDVHRGRHAHRHLRQLAVALRGAVTIRVDDGRDSAEFVLDDPSEGLLLGDMMWRELYDFSDDCVLMVLADRLYDPDDYITRRREPGMESRMSVPFYDLKTINARHADALKAAAARVIDSGWYVLGDEVEAFEQEFAGYCGARHAIGVGNGLDALALILRAYRELGALKEGDEVLVPANTFIATLLAVSQNGLVPVPVEPDPRSFNLDPERAAAAIGPRTRAIVAVHLYGQLADMDALTALSRDQGLLLIEDAAQAHGAELDGRRPGSLGDAAAFSFFPTKNLGALGDGGAVVTQDDALARQVVALR
ncbi:hypothetical protein KCV01_g22233, partial [Aureobasidium melanogenum]